MLVMKFGGTSVGSAEALRNVAAIIADNKSREPAVVVSALSEVTNALFAAAECAVQGNVSIDAIAKRHYSVMDGLGIPRNVIENELGGLEEAVNCAHCSLTPKVQALIASFGERMSKKIVAAYGQSVGLNTVAYDAFDIGLLTNSNYLDAEVLPVSYGEIANFLLNRIGPGIIPVITGYIAKDGKGDITVLGRGASDYTATIIGNAVGASEVQIWTDADGIMTADPRIVPAARTIRSVSYDEAAELAYFGAKVIHPKTIAPVKDKRIPVKVLNTFNRSSAGTIIGPEHVGNGPVTTITYKKGISPVKVSSTDMVEDPGYAARILGEFGRRNVSVDIIATSNISVSQTVDVNREIGNVIASLERYSRVNVGQGRASVSIIGDGMRSTPGVAARAFAAVAERGINVEMISQGWLERNLTMVIEEKYLNDAVRSLHAAFFEKSQ